jgi:hypothetical protein
VSKAAMSAKRVASPSRMSNPSAASIQGKTRPKAVMDQGGSGVA